MTNTSIKLTRQALADSLAKKMTEARDGTNTTLSDEEILASRRRLVPDNPSEDIWVFGYGSLIWSPVIEVSATQMGRLYGYHRRFCLQTTIGRGSPEQPGLMLGLDRGGSCAGQLLRIERSIAAHELDLLWRREIFANAYIPKWLNVRCADGSSVKAVTFVINRHYIGYVTGLSIEDEVQMITSATGFFGTCLEYFERTHGAFSDIGIRDNHIERMMKRIRNQKHAE